MNLFLSSHRSLLSVALTASLLAGLTSCQDEDFGYAKDEIAYETNFKKAFGNIPADQSWDLSSAAKWVDPLSADGAMSETRATRAGGLPFTKMADFWEVPNGIFSWMQSRLIEGNDNRYLGSSFILKVPDSDFAIIPIFQGNSAITSELEVKVNGFDLTKVWTKSEGMKATDTDNDEDAKPLGYYEGWSGYDKYYDTTPNHPASTIKAKKVWTKPIVFNSSDLGAGKFMYLSLHNIAKLYNSDGSVWDSGNTWTTVGDRLTSINPNGQMLALDVDWTVKNSLKSLLPQIVEGKDPSEMMIIGCEDANGSSSDHDNNDIVFLIVGYPSVPTVIPLTETIEKRYMCEDLGGTHDFDFNDIVVDVKQVSTYTLTTTPEVSDWNFNSGANSVEISGVDKTKYTRKQTAKIAHVCGTLPIQAQVGNYLFPWISDPTDQAQTRTELLAGGWTFNGSSWDADTSTNDKTRGTQPKDGWNPNEEKTITGWNPSENNIKVYVQWPKNWKSEPGHDLGVSSPTTGPGSADDYIYKVSNPYLDANMQAILIDFRDFDYDRLKQVSFPDNGRVPYIIAVDPSVKWMQEDECIDMAWLRQADHTTKDHTNESGVGSGGYYENPNSDAPEVVVWQGSFTGEKWNHGKDFPVGSAEYNGIIDAFDGYAQCNTLNIYFDKSYTDRGNTDKTISLATHGPSGWQRLTDTEADNYVAPKDVTPVTIDGKPCYCLQVKLTSEQIAAIRTGGLVVQLSSDNVMLHKISFTKESGFEINLAMPDHGKIETASRKRERYGADTGRVPFTHAAYVTGSSVELVAVPDEGYMFDGWENQSGTVVSTSVRYTVSGDANLRARFVEAQYIPVGLILQSRSYDSTSDDYSDDYTIDHPTLTVNNGKFYSHENDTYTPMSETTFSVTDASSRVYVVRGTSVTFSVQKNSDYIFESGTNFETKETAYERTSGVVLSNGNTQYTPYVKFKEKQDPALTLSESSITLSATNQQTNITWTSYSSADIKYNKNWSEYDYQKDINIWGSNGTLTIKAQRPGITKTVTFWQEATDEYKHAEVSLTVTVEQNSEIEPSESDESASDGYKYYSFDASKIEEQLFNNLNSDKFDKVKIYVYRKDYNLESWIIETSEASSWYILPLLNNTYMTDSEAFKWEDPSSHMALSFILTKDEWNTYFQGDKKLVVKSNTGPYKIKVEPIYKD